MPRRSLAQISFFDPDFACPGCLEHGTVPWLLARFRSKLPPAWLFVGWRGRRQGRKAWPAAVLMTLVLLRWTEEGMSLVSMTDPQARHGRKSKSETFKGFKLHVVGDVVSGLITSLAVTPGNHHDNRPAHRLIRRASDLLNGIHRLLGDTAYGAASFRREVRQTLGVEIVAPPPPASSAKGDRFGKHDFEIDFAAGQAMCPNGVISSKFTTVQAHGGRSRRHAWPRQACDRCPMVNRCLASGRRSRTLLLHPDEEEQREARRNWERPKTRAEYRTRSQCERRINQMTRHGGRKARAWGLGFAQLQVHAIAAVCNLGLLAKLYAERG